MRSNILSILKHNKFYRFRYWLVVDWWRFLAPLRIFMNERIITNPNFLFNISFEYEWTFLNGAIAGIVISSQIGIKWYNSKYINNIQKNWECIQRFLVIILWTLFSTWKFNLPNLLAPIRIGNWSNIDWNPHKRIISTLKIYK